MPPRSLPSLAVAAVVLLSSVSAGVGAGELRRGFNAYPWFYRAAPVAGDAAPAAVTAVYPFAERFTAADFAALRRRGADFIRVPVDPTPLLTAGPGTRAALVTAMVATLARVTGAGMTAVVDLHPAEEGKGWGSADILHDPAKLRGYRDLLVDVARAILAAGTDRLVLELMNEPQGGWGGQEGTYWLTEQPALVRAVRVVAPTLRLVVSGDQGGGVDGLLRLEPKNIDDPAILYSFHDYDPMVVTHQGAAWGDAPYRRLLRGVPYPAAPGSAPAVIAAFQARVAADPKAPVVDKVRMAEAGAHALADYLRVPDSAAALERRVARVADWARRNGIPSARVLLGEFGVLRPGASRDAAIHWAHDMRAAAERHGFAWAYFNYSPADENGAGFSVLRMAGPAPNALDDGFLREGLGLVGPP